MNHCQRPVLVSRFGLVEPPMRRLRLHVDYGRYDDPNLAALHLFAKVIQDAVDLVRGARHASATLPAKQADVEAARAWIRDGNIGMLSFNGCCGWLGWDAEHVRQAIFRAERRA